MVLILVSSGDAWMMARNDASRNGGKAKTAAGPPSSEPVRLPDVPRRPVQDRSRAATERMIAAGKHLLTTRDFDLISIRDIAGEAGTSIGSFYHRFGTKEDYFRFLIDDMVVRREALAMAQFAQMAMPDLPAAVARGAVANHLAHAGLLRAAIRRHLSGSDVWAPVRMMGQRILNEYRRLLSQHLGRPLKAREAERIGLAFVWLYGVLIQSVLEVNPIADYGIDPEIFGAEAVINFVAMLDRAMA